MPVGTSDCVCIILVLVVAFLLGLYVSKEFGKTTPHKSDAFALRSSAGVSPRMRNKPVAVESSESTSDSAVFDTDTGMPLAWRSSQPSSRGTSDGGFTWEASEEECSVSSLKAPSKDKARVGANRTPFQNVTMDRSSFAKGTGTRTIDALRPKTQFVISADTPIVFNDSGYRQTYINEYGGGCFAKAENMNACGFDRCLRT